MCEVDLLSSYYLSNVLTCVGLAQVSISFIAINAPTLAEWLGEHAIPFLHDETTDVNVTEHEFLQMKTGASMGAVGALALLLLLGCSLVEEGVVMTGYVDLRGRMMMVDRASDRR